MDQSPQDAACEAATTSSSDTTATLHVCVSCRAGTDREAEPLPGARLYDALIHAVQIQARPGIRIAAVECLSNCNRGCSVALTGPGRWSYVYGDLTEAAIGELLDGAERYASTADGLVPWRERPAILRKGVIARIPPSLATA